VVREERRVPADGPRDEGKEEYGRPRADKRVDKYRLADSMVRDRETLRKTMPSVDRKAATRQQPFGEEIA